MSLTVIQTPYNRKFSIGPSGPKQVWFNLVELDGDESITSVIENEQAVEIGKLVLDSAKAVSFVCEEWQIPAVVTEGGTIVAGSVRRSSQVDVDLLETQIRALIAIHRERTKVVVEETKLTERRDAEARELSGDETRTYGGCTEILKAAIDKIIDLQDEL